MLFGRVTAANSSQGKKQRDLESNVTVQFNSSFNHLCGTNSSCIFTNFTNSMSTRLKLVTKRKGKITAKKPSLTQFSTTTKDKVKSKRINETSLLTQYWGSRMWNTRFKSYFKNDFTMVFKRDFQGSLYFDISIFDNEIWVSRLKAIYIHHETGDLLTKIKNSIAIGSMNIIHMVRARNGDTFVKMKGDKYNFPLWFIIIKGKATPHKLSPAFSHIIQMYAFNEHVYGLQIGKNLKRVLQFTLSDNITDPKKRWKKEKVYSLKYRSDYVPDDMRPQLIVNKSPHSTA